MGTPPLVTPQQGCPRPSMAISGLPGPSCLILPRDTPQARPQSPSSPPAGPSLDTPSLFLAMKGVSEGLVSVLESTKKRPSVKTAGKEEAPPHSLDRPPARRWPHKALAVETPARAQDPSRGRSVSPSPQERVSGASSVLPCWACGGSSRLWAPDLGPGRALQFQAPPPTCLRTWWHWPVPPWQTGTVPQ